jgi:type VI protein secretion system component Hcp
LADSSEILMVLVKGGTAISGEAQADFSGHDPLLKASADGKWPTKFEATKIFSLDSFSLNIQAEQSDAPDAKNATGITAVVGNKVQSVSTARKPGRNTTWKPGMLGQISCTRNFDVTSSVLFEDCGNATPYDFAAIVQRKVMGQQHPSKVHALMSYVRLDFKKVVIVEVSWSAQDDGIKETFQFVADEAAVQYRQQLHSGDFHAALPSNTWKK